MGHKVNPIGLRIGVNRTWDSRWFAARGEYGRLLHEDMRIRDHIQGRDRAAAQEVPRDGSHRAPGCPDRQEGR
jgi:hypothetical protein